MEPAASKLSPRRGKKNAPELQQTRSSPRFGRPVTEAKNQLLSRELVMIQRLRTENMLGQRLMTIQGVATPIVMDPEPMQQQCPDPTWKTPELPRNFFVTGYSPNTMDLESSMSPPEQTAPSVPFGTFAKFVPPYNSVGSPVEPHIAEIARQVSGMNSQSTKMPAAASTHRQKKVVEVAEMRPPDPPVSDVPPSWSHEMPPVGAISHRPKKVPKVAGMHPPNPHVSHAPPSAQGLPRRAPAQSKSEKRGQHPQPKTHDWSSKVRSSTELLQRKRDPLLHRSDVTPPCPIRPGENVTPAEGRVHTHGSA